MQFNLRILSLDAALANTGFCIYEVNTVNFRFKIKDFGVIETDAGTDMGSRIRLILSEVNKTIQKYNINYIIIEEPPLTLYGSHFLNKNQLIGRAASVIQLAAAVYAITGFVHALGVYYRCVMPVQWQSEQLGKVAKGKFKAESIRKAKVVLQLLNIKKKILIGEDHLADAINIGIYAIKKLQSGEWIVPESCLRLYENTVI